MRFGVFPFPCPRFLTKSRLNDQMAGSAVAGGRVTPFAMHMGAPGATGHLAYALCKSRFAPKSGRLVPRVSRHLRQPQIPDRRGAFDVPAIRGSFCGRKSDGRGGQTGRGPSPLWSVGQKKRDPVGDRRRQELCHLPSRFDGARFSERGNPVGLAEGLLFSWDVLARPKRPHAPNHRQYYSKSLKAEAPGPAPPWAVRSRGRQTTAGATADSRPDAG